MTMNDLISRKDAIDIMNANGDVAQETPKAVFYCAAHLLETLPAAKINGSTSDGYHTFDELYHHRAVLFSVIVKAYPDGAWKSKKHHDGTMYDGMFIVGINTPWGQATYHCDIDPYWDIFECRELECAPKWDGHSPAEAIDRIGKLIPLRHGHWIQAGHDGWSSYIKCSKCKRYLRDIHPSDYKFCPYCGAKMDEQWGGENKEGCQWH